MATSFMQFCMCLPAETLMISNVSAQLVNRNRTLQQPGNTTRGVPRGSPWYTLQSPGKPLAVYHSSSVVPWATFYLGTGTMVSPVVNPQGIPQQILVEVSHRVGIVNCR